MTKKKNGSRQTTFGPDHLPLQIDDLPGVEPAKLTRHFPKRRRSRGANVPNKKVDPVRSRAVKGLGLVRGRRFFES
jgi:hypothetical protein